MKKHVTVEDVRSLFGMTWARRDFEARFPGAMAVSFVGSKPPYDPYSPRSRSQFPEASFVAVCHIDPLGSLVGEREDSERFRACRESY